MRILAAVLFLLMSSSLFSQPNSVRLFGMGNVSIAVPDPEGEAFVNPAKVVRLTGVFLRLRPTYLRDSRPSDGSSSYISGGSSYSSNYSSDNTQTDALAPVDGVISLNPLYVGGSASYQITSWNTSNESGDRNPSYTQSNRSKNETNGPSTSLSLLGAFDLGGVSVGASASMSNTSQENKFSSVYASSPPGTTNSNESESKFESNGTSLVAGFFAGSLDTYEISVYGNLGFSKSENEPTRIVSNGVPQPLNEPYVNRNEASNNSVFAEIRKRIDERFLLGGRISRSSSSSDDFNKSRWYSSSNPQGIYDERKTGTSEETSYEFGAGCSWTVQSGGVFSVEFLLSPNTYTRKKFSPTEGTYDGRVYRRGDVAYEAEDKRLAKTLRLGGEIPVADGLSLRVGAEVIWSSLENTSRQFYDQRTEKNTGIVDAAFYGGGGFSYALSPFRVDYTLSAIPKIMYSSYPYYGPYYGPYSPSQIDVLMRHHLTVALQL
ncbi:MAG: hypothetical protein HW374_1530 [Bacteroidetes bacterium]|nr:hypothetical protein [Bacteroidota bacterium]